MILLTLIAHLLALVTPNYVPLAEVNKTLTIELTGIKPAEGNILLSLYKNAEGFPSDTKAVYMSSKTKVSANTITVSLNNVPNGTYAIAFFHDANANGKMDKNFVGLPKEGYGFSNDAMGKFGPPSFKEASFTYTGKEKVTMKVKYL